MERLLATVEGSDEQVYLRARADGSLIVSPETVTDRELLSGYYTVKTAWTGASVSNVIRQTMALDVSGAAMAIISVMWENETSGAVISAPPSVNEYLEPLMRGDSLTLAQLLSARLATADNQLAQIGYLADIAQGQGRYASYVTQQVDETSTGTTYIRKAGADAEDTWLVQRVVESGTDTTISYAGVRNNALITAAAQAWINRTTLTYGDIGQA